MVYFWIIFFIVGSPICLWLQHGQRQEKRKKDSEGKQRLDRLNSKEPGGEQDLYSTNTINTGTNINGSWEDEWQ